MTRSEAIRDAVSRLTSAGIPSADTRAEALLLLRHAAGITREEFAMRPDTLLSADQLDAFSAAIARRSRREPLAYITGERGFYGLAFAVSPAVLVPRPETEGVVEAALERIRGASGSVLDIGTGSGAIAISVAVNAPSVGVYATDLSEDALTIARANAVRNGVADRVTFLQGDLFAPVPAGLRFDVIASNPPYIAPAEIELLEPEVRDFEPRLALGVHADALHFYRRLATEAPLFLAPGGVLIVEVGSGQAQSVAALFTHAGLDSVVTLQDLAGIDRVVIGQHAR